jgi:hypothetical protein
MPIKNVKKSNSKYRKRSILCLGNTIVCPLVTYNKKNLGNTIFTSEYDFDLDWDTFLKLANQEGRFLYVDQVLGHYRVHDEATSKDFIVNHKRECEDESMFNQFWPRWVTKLIMFFYKFAYKTYD